MKKSESISVSIIHTLSQSFIEDNIESLCELIFGVNIRSNKEVVVSFPDNGGFQYSGPTGFGRSVGVGLKSVDDVVPALNELFSKLNKALAKASAATSEEAGFDFFPLKYMKPITVYPNYINGGNAAVSYTARYRIEVPGYEKPGSRQKEPANVMNAGVEATLTRNGEVTDMKYFLLPFKTGENRKQLDRTLLNGETNPQLVYLQNKETNLVAPFFLASNKEAYIPATNESIIPVTYQLNDPIPPTSFNPNKVVVWLDQTVKENNSVVLPKGAKLIRLKPATDTSELTNCIYWWNGDYHQRSFPEKILVTSNWHINEYTGEVLQNSIEHLLHRVDDYRGKQTDFDEVIKKIETFNNKRLTQEEIDLGTVILWINLLVNKKDKPDTLKRIADAIFQVYDPVNKTKKMSEETLIILLSYQWFASDPALLRRYDRLWSSGNLSRLTGSSGEVVFNGYPEFNEIRDELIALKDFVLRKNVKGKDEMVSNATVDSPEAKWLQTLTKEFIDSKQQMLFIHSGTWDLDSQNRYADSVAIENSFGPFRLPPVLNVMLHELRVGGDQFLYFAHGTNPESGLSFDTHIDKEYTRFQWNKASSGGFNDILKNQDFVDQLYQSHRALAALALGIIIHQITTQ